jgi:hypothetical protein
MKDKIITIKVDGAAQGQWSSLLLELNFNETSMEIVWCRYNFKSTWIKKYLESWNKSK